MIREYLNFSRRERIAVLIIFALIISLYTIPYLPSFSRSPKGPVFDSGWAIAIKSREIQPDSALIAHRYPQLPPANRVQTIHSPQAEQTKHSLFPFDPNTLDAAGWQGLGLREKTISTISHYIAKGGRFKEARDLQKIYGLSPGDFARLSPYVQIPRAESRLAAVNTGEAHTKKNNYPPYYHQPVPVDINKADTTDLIRLPGIGTKLANRIIKFRDKLGGFYDIGQLREIYGLSDSVFTFIRPMMRLDNPTLKQVHLNSATREELASHPYIRRELGNAIIEYREQHGHFNKTEELLNIIILNDQHYLKLVNYITL